ncbi:MAG: DeoR/GlpR family DNA-binding transcription regulator [Shinella sp.]|nr:DeoR/GlpR family DNA-binding transcription regulator [Shinella sp.]
MIGFDMLATELLLGERQALIQERLERSGRVIAAELAQELAVSEDTIRRDLREMAAAGLCRRVYGGALPVSPASGSLSERMAIGTERKQALARASISFIEPGSTIFLDAGSTNLAIAQALPEDRDLTVATNAPSIAATLIDRSGVDIIQIGGQVDKKVGGAIGAKAMRDAEALRPDLCILGVCGIDRDAGVTAYSFEDAEFKRFLAQRSRAVLVAVTSDKLSTAAAYAVIPLSSVSCAVFEADADEQEVAAYASAGLRILRAQ